MIELPPDFRDVLVELVDAGAAFVVIGGYAVAFHGHVRAMIKNKRASGRPQDIADATVLESISASGA